MEIQNAELIIKKTDIKCILINFSIIFSIGIILTIISIIFANIIDDNIVKLSVIIPCSIIGFGLILASICYLVLSRNWRNKH